ncbi:MAG: DUF4148 domain-containing protein [Burkholderiales bacterium]|nr:DUF4148 domain-containing protein [Burkholderiales bacterium]
MNRSTHTVIAAALALVAGASYAQAGRNIPPTWANEDMSVNTFVNTRAQVQAELAAARANGQMDSFDNLAYLKQDPVGNPVAPILAKVRAGAERVAATQSSGLTREQVRADLDAARRSGELNAFDNLAYMNSQGGSRAQLAPDTLARR